MVRDNHILQTRVPQKELPCLDVVYHTAGDCWIEIRYWTWANLDYAVSLIDDRDRLTFFSARESIAGRFLKGLSTDRSRAQDHQTSTDQKHRNTVLSFRRVVHIQNLGSRDQQSYSHLMVWRANDEDQ